MTETNVVVIESEEDIYNQYATIDSKFIPEFDELMFEIDDIECVK